MDNKVITNKKNTKVIEFVIGGETYQRGRFESYNKFYDRVEQELQEKGIDFTSILKSENFKKERKNAKEVKQASINMKKRIAATVIASVVGLTGLGIVTGCSFGNKNADKTNTTKQELNIDEESYKNKSVKELIGLLKTESRKSAFDKANNTYDYFKNTAALSVQTEEDKNSNKQLFINGDEALSAYIYANIKSIGADKIANIYGESKVLQTETGKYIKLDADTVSGKYLVFNMNLSYYYQRGATETSGVSNIFERSEEAQFFDNFESLILEYNKTKDPQIASEICKQLEEIYMSGNIDNLMKKYPGATSIIGSAIVPYLWLEGIIDKTTYDSLKEINETITCQEIYSQIKNACEEIDLEESKKVSEEQQEIMVTIVKKQNKNTRSLDRNISMENTLEGYSLSDLENAVLDGSGFKNNKTVKRTITKSKEQAIASSTKEKVEKAEKEADKELDKKTEEENEKWDNVLNGDTAGYDAAWAELTKGGDGYVTTPKGYDNKSYQNGAAAARADWAKAKKDQAEYDKKLESEKTKTEDKETTFVPVKPSDSETNSEPIITEPKIEIIEETFVPETQKVKSVEREGEVYETPNEQTTSKVKSYGAQV